MKRTLLSSDIMVPAMAVAEANCSSPTEILIRVSKASCLKIKEHTFCNSVQQQQGKHTQKQITVASIWLKFRGLAFIIFRARVPLNIKIANFYQDIIYHSIFIHFQNFAKALKMLYWSNPPSPKIWPNPILFCRKNIK